MSDIVARLRMVRDAYESAVVVRPSEWAEVIKEAADEIERLRDLLLRLIDNVQTGSYESTAQYIDECRRTTNKQQGGIVYRKRGEPS